MDLWYKMKRIGIIGSRRRNSEKDFEQLLKWFNLIYEPGDCIVSGGCPKGGDKFAEQLAKMLMMDIIELKDGDIPETNDSHTIYIHYPQWEKHGKIAGFYRNTFIARDSDILIALIAKDRKGGTEDTLRKHEGVQIIIP